MTPARPFALRLFEPSGLPEGMRIVEKTNWSGIGYVIPRSQLKEFTQREESARPGVYVLSGPDPEGGADLVYIGEADPLGRRLEQHQAKEFWTTAFAFTSKDGYLNKAHAQHLETRLIRLAQDGKRCRLENAVQGRSITLAEMDRAVAEGFRVAVADGFLEELLLWPRARAPHVRAALGQAGHLQQAPVPAEGARSLRARVRVARRLHGAPWCPGPPRVRRVHPRRLGTGQGSTGEPGRVPGGAHRAHPRPGLRVQLPLPGGHGTARPTGQWPDRLEGCQGRHAQGAPGAGGSGCLGGWGGVIFLAGGG